VLPCPVLPQTPPSRAGSGLCGGDESVWWRCRHWLLLRVSCAGGGGSEVDRQGAARGARVVALSATVRPAAARGGLPPTPADL